MLQESLQVEQHTPSTPTAIEGRTLHFKFENLRPTEEDDIVVLYDPMSVQKAFGYGSYAVTKELLHKRLQIPTSSNRTKPNPNQQKSSSE